MPRWPRATGRSQRVLGRPQQVRRMTPPATGPPHRGLQANLESSSSIPPPEDPVTTPRPGSHLRHETGASVPSALSSCQCGNWEKIESVLNFSALNSRRMDAAEETV